MSLTPASACSPTPCRLPQPALELQQERLELDSGKTALAETSQSEQRRQRRTLSRILFHSSRRGLPLPPTAGLGLGLEAGDCQCGTQLLAGQTVLPDPSSAQARLFPDCGVSDSGSRG